MNLLRMLSFGAGAVIVTLAVGSCSTDRFRLSEQTGFLASYRGIVAKENGFVHPDERIGGDFYRYVIPYNHFLSNLSNTSPKEIGIPRCRMFLVQESGGDIERRRQLILLAAEKYGVAESALILDVRGQLIRRAELERLVQEGYRATKFFEWTTATQRFR